MLHTGDIFETRARQHRAEELRALTRTLTGFLFRANRQKPLSRTERCSHLVHAAPLPATRQTGCCA